MKKRLVYIAILAFTLILALSLAACNQTDKAEDKKDEGQTTEKDKDEAKDEAGKKNKKDEEAKKEDEKKEEAKEDNQNEDAQAQGSEGGEPIETAGAMMKYFELRSSGGVAGIMVKYILSREADGVYFIYDDITSENKDGMKVLVDEELFDKVRSLYDKYEVEKWNGYSMEAKDVIDGEGFGLEIAFDNGERLFAHGYHKFPENYKEFQTEIEALLKPYAEDLLKAQKQKLIEQGVKGDIKYLTVNFIQEGGNSYQIRLSNNDSGKHYNFNLEIVSKDGEFFEEGDYQYYSTIPLEAINFEGIKELIEKYEIITWNGFNDSSKDAAGNEQFQIDITFEDGSINAMGTVKPENYEDFRRDFLELMAANLESAIEEQGIEKN